MLEKHLNKNGDTLVAEFGNKAYQNIWFLYVIGNICCINL
jgi:hypothetical protein